MAGEIEGESGPGPGPEFPPRVPEREQPSERREERERRESSQGGPDPILAEVQAMENYNREMNRRLLGRKLNQLLQNPAEQEKYNRDPERYLAEVEASEEFRREQEAMGTRESIQEQFLRDYERARSDPRLGYETARGRSTEDMQGREGWQQIEVRSSAGILHPVWMPISDEGKRYFVSEVLARIEATPEAEGGFTDKRALEETALAITAIIENSEKYTEHDRNLGQELKKKFLARLKLHGVYQQFSKASTAKDVVQILTAITADELNTLFKDIPEVQQAFLLHEKYADEFLGAESKRDEIRIRIASETVGEKPSEIVGLRDIDPNWAQRIAERLWEITGRRAIRDRLISSDPSMPIKEAYKAKGKVDFLSGGANTGNFYVRRSLQFKRWVRQVGEVYNPFFQLLQGWDLGSKDLFTRLVESTESKIKREKYATLRGSNGIAEPASKADKETADQAAEKETSKIFGDLPKDQPNDESKENQRWPILANWREDDEEGEVKTKEPYADYLQRVNWTDVDFSVIGAYPLLEWALYQVGYPDEARGALIGEDEKFLQNPSYESLKKAANAFVYMGSRSNYIKETLFTNCVNFEGMDYERELGKRNLTRSELDREIGTAQTDKFIQPDKAKKLRNEMYSINLFGFQLTSGNNISRGVLSFIDSISVLGGFWGMLKKFLESLLPGK